MISEEIRKRVEASSKDRLGEAYRRLNCFAWDPIFGEAPEGFFTMTDKEKYQDPYFREVYDLISELLSEKEKSMYWWTMALGKTYEEWKNWWETEGCRFAYYGILPKKGPEEKDE